MEHDTVVADLRDELEQKLENRDQELEELRHQAAQQVGGRRGGDGNRADTTVTMTNTTITITNTTITRKPS